MHIVHMLPLSFAYVRPYSTCDFVVFVIRQKAKHASPSSQYNKLLGRGAIAEELRRPHSV